MTRRMNAGVAGFTYLFYIAVAFPEMVLIQRATTGATTAKKLLAIGAHATDMRVAVILSFLSCISALVLAVTLYAITRDEDRDLALLGFAGRVAEGVIGAVSIPATVGLLWLATSAGPADSSSYKLAEFLMQDWSTTVGAFMFSLGSTMFCYLLLRGRIVPAPLAALGFIGSLLLVVVLPAQLAGFITGRITSLAWIPIAIFEIVVALWLLIKGAAMPRVRNPVVAK